MIFSYAGLEVPLFAGSTVLLQNGRLKGSDVELTFVAMLVRGGRNWS